MIVCDKEDCEYYAYGFCSADDYVEIVSLECITYKCKDEKEEKLNE